MDQSIIDVVCASQGQTMLSGMPVKLMYFLLFFYSTHMAHLKNRCKLSQGSAVADCVANCANIVKRAGVPILVCTPEQYVSAHVKLASFVQSS